MSLSAAKLDFIKTPIKPQQNVAAFKVSLGIMPDYSSSKGLRIDAVIADRPAEKAGMLAGDVIKKIGENAVSDIYSYMECLSKCKAGETKAVTVERNGTTLVFEVTF